MQFALIVVKEATHIIIVVQNLTQGCRVMLGADKTTMTTVFVNNRVKAALAQIRETEKGPYLVYK